MVLTVLWKVALKRKDVKRCWVFFFFFLSYWNTLKSWCFLLLRAKYSCFSIALKGNCLCPYLHGHLWVPALYISVAEWLRVAVVSVSLLADVSQVHSKSGFSQNLNWVNIWQNKSDVFKFAPKVNGDFSGVFPLSGGRRINCNWWNHAVCLFFTLPLLCFVYFCVVSWKVVTFFCPFCFLFIKNMPFLLKVTSSCDM